MAGSDSDKENTPINTMSVQEPTAYITIQRRLYTQDLVDKEYEDQTIKPSFKEHIKSACTCSLSRVLNLLLGYFPVIGVIRKYAWKANVVNDFVAALSVSFMQMPQGFAFGVLASVPPVFGLYSTFYPVLLYVIFGTCPHISMGTNALLSLITAGIVDSELEDHMAKQMASTTNLATGSGSLNGTIMMSEEEQNAYKVGVAAAAALITGSLLLFMGFFKLGFITSYMSTSFVGGFTTGGSIHIVTSQIPKMLNIKVPPHRGAGRLVKTYIDIFKNVDESNLGDIIVTAISILFLLTLTIFVNERYRKKLRVPIPLDLIIVVVSTIISHLANLEDNYGVAVVGDIPLGLPAPTIPETEAMGRIFVDSFVMAILVFALNISMAKLTAGIHNYPIDPDQELVAYGMCNFVSSFFRCIPGCIAPPRVMILSNIGAKSTLNGIITALFIFITLLAAGQLFASLPVAVLAAMICVALKNLLLQFKQVPDLWRISKPDFCIWISTCFASVFIDLDIGIAIGMGISLLTVIVRNQLASGTIGGLSKKEDLVLFGKDKKGTRENEKFRIFYFPSQLFFANAERFSKEIFSKAFNPLPVEAKSPDQNVDTDNHDGSEIPAADDVDEKSDKNVKYVILDCSAITYIDIAGSKVLKKVSSQYQKAGVTLMLARCPAYTLDLLDRAGYFKTMDRNTVFYDLYDAVTCINQGSV